MPVTVDSKLQSLKTVIKHEFNNAYGKLSPDSFYNKVCTEIASNSASNTYDLLGDFPEFKEWTSARQVKDMKELILYPGAKNQKTFAVPSTLPDSLIALFVAFTIVSCIVTSILPHWSYVLFTAIPFSVSVIVHLLIVTVAPPHTSIPEDAHSVYVDLEFITLTFWM